MNNIAAVSALSVYAYQFQFLFIDTSQRRIKAWKEDAQIVGVAAECMKQSQFNSFANLC